MVTVIEKVITEKKKLVVSIVGYKDEQKIDIRVWYKSDKSGKFFSSRAGVRFSLQEFGKVIDILSEDLIQSIMLKLGELG